MAITNAQQYQQLVNKPANGKRPGYRGSDMASVGTSTRAANTSQKDTSGADYGGGNQGRDAATSSGADDRSSALQTYNTKVATGRLSDEDYETFDDVPLNKREQELKNFLDRRNDVNLFGLSKIFTGPAQKFSDFNASINRPFFEKVIRAGKIPGLSFDMTEDELEDAYQNYMSSRLSGEIDAYGNPLNQGGDGPDQPIISLMAQAPVTEEPEVDPDSLEGMLANRVAYRFMADGGRAEFAEGGGIESRLEQLGGDVSSAEQMLQAINQRLQSAESSLGSGGGGLGTLATLAGSNQPFNPGNFQPTIPADGKLPQNPLDPGSNANFSFGSINNSVITQPLGDPLQIGKLGQIPEQFRSGFDEYLKNNETSFGFGGQAISGVGLPGGGSVMFGDTGSAGAFRDYLKSTGFNPPSPLGQPLQSSLTATGGGMGSPLQHSSGLYQFGPGRALTPGQSNTDGSISPMQSPLQTALGLADGGRAGMMDGGMMEDTPEGGIMDLESGRQMYFLGKLVKKATRAVKKIAKSPIGKAALLYAGGSFLGGGGLE
jgi:hypothetical protein